MGRIILRFGMLFGVASLLSMVTLAGAQSAALCTKGNYGFSTWVVGHKTNAPFTGTAKTTFEQTLADGNRIHGEARALQARDSAGRTHKETVQGCELGEDGQLHAQLSVLVYDPTTHTSLIWRVDDNSSKEVHVYHLEVTPQKTQTPEERAAQEQQMKIAREQQQQQQKQFITVQLGIQEFNGQQAKGSRSTRTIPAGEEGNDTPLELTNETWRSTSLDLVLMAVSNDPRRGKHTFVYEDLKLGEPDPSLFTAPAGYKVVDEHPNTTTESEAR